MSEDNFVFKDGEMKFGKEKEAESKTKAFNAQAPFTELTEKITIAIGDFFESNKGKDATLDGRDMLVVVVGALAYCVGHFYNFMSKIGTVSSVDDFLKDFNKQVKLSVKLFHDQDIEDKDNGK